MPNLRLSRRDYLKLQALAAGGLALTGSSAARSAAASETRSTNTCFDELNDPTQMNSLFAALEPVCPGEPLAEGEMRITFLGTSCTPMLTQQGISLYVELGPTDGYGEPLDYAIFDCGMGVLANYIAAGVPYGRMDKIFIAHLHADHLSELSAIYCFGESADRKSPLYVWGPSASGVPDPVTGKIYNDGIRATLEHFREVWRWHTEAFSFTYNGYTSYEPPTKESWGLPHDPVPVGEYVKYQDPLNDSYALVPIELNWKKSGKVQGDNVAYWNKNTGLKITHFPVIHCRKGSIGYKLEWTPPTRPDTTLSMVYSSDTRPAYTMIEQARSADILIHEVVMPPLAWAMKFMHTSDPSTLDPKVVTYLTNVQNSSHTTQAAFGYLLSQIDPAPRLAVATHFQATDDTIESARQTLDAFEIPRDAYTFALDFMVLNVTGDTITQLRMDVSRHAYPVIGAPNPPPYTTPKYHKVVDSPIGPVLVGDPEAQLLLDDAILPGSDTYSEDGYWPGSCDESCA